MSAPRRSGVVANRPAGGLSAGRIGRGPSPTTLRPTGLTPTVRSDNGLIFQSRRFPRACRDYRLSQEFITPYTPEQNGMIERFFRSLKEECTWQYMFRGFNHARHVIRRWIDWYNRGRPHQSLNYLSPVEYRAQQLGQVA